MSKNTIDPEWMRDVRVAEYLDVSAMTIWRWDNLPEYTHLNFPKPAIINNQKYRNRTALNEWMRARVAEGVKIREVRAKARDQAKANVEPRIEARAKLRAASEQHSRKPARAAR